MDTKIISTIYRASKKAQKKKKKKTLKKKNTYRPPPKTPGFCTIIGETRHSFKQLPPCQKKKKKSTRAAGFGEETSFFSPLQTLHNTKKKKRAQITFSVNKSPQQKKKRLG